MLRADIQYQRQVSYRKYRYFSGVYYVGQLYYICINGEAYQYGKDNSPGPERKEVQGDAWY